MLQGLITYFRTRIDLALKSAAWSAAAAVAGMIAFGFFGAAAFVAIAARLGVVDACLVFGGMFTAVCAATVTIAVLLRRRTAHANARLARAMSDARTVTMGVDIARLLRGKPAAAGLIGAFLVGLLISRSRPKH